MSDIEEHEYSIFDPVNISDTSPSAQNSAINAQLDRFSGQRTREVIEPGSGFVPETSSFPNGSVGILLDGKKVSVNFVNTELQEFVRAVFEDVLKKNYTIDPRLKGSITIRTSSPISKKHLLELTKKALVANKANLLYKDGTYQVVAGADNRAEQPTRIVQLSYVNAEKLAEELKPITPSTIQLIPFRSTDAILLKGPPRDIDAVQSVIHSFDIDRMKGMSFALLPVKNAPATVVAEELGRVFGTQENPGTSVLAIARMNAILVISRKSSTLYTAKKWLRRLDRQNETAVRSYVYSVQNRQAEELAKILQIAFLDSNNTPAQSSPQLSQETSVIPAVARTNEVNKNYSGNTKEHQAKITADPATNSLIIFATPVQYKLIRAALYRLDIVPLQVLIEATIAEVRLNHSLRRGVSWYLKHKNFGANFSPKGSESFSETQPGFNVFVDSSQGKFVLNALEGVTNVEIISTPSMTVLDNQTAKLQVGDQVPITTQSATSTQDASAPIVNSVELRDTGIILSVTPRVNSSGLVVLDIIQEVSDVVPTTTSGIDSPTIRQRKFESSVAVKNGSAIVLGGLISRRKSTNESGAPIVKDIPILGELFKSTKNDVEKTELIVIIRPTVIYNQNDIYSVANEFRRKMRGIESLKP